MAFFGFYLNFSASCAIFIYVNVEIVITTYMQFNTSIIRLRIKYNRWLFSTYGEKE